MVKKVGKGLVLQWNTYWVMKRIPKDVKSHFESKARFSQNLKTSNFAAAATMAEPYLVKWDYMIKMARLKNSGHIVDLENAVAVAEKSYERFGGALQGMAAASILVGLEQVLDDQSDSKISRLKVVGEATGNLTPIPKHSDQFFKAYGYSEALAYEARKFIEIRFAKEFKYFETVTVEELKAYIKVRMDGSDGSRAWSESSVAKNIGFINNK